MMPYFFVFLFFSFLPFKTKANNKKEKRKGSRAASAFQVNHSSVVFCNADVQI